LVIVLAAAAGSSAVVIDFAPPLQLRRTLRPHAATINCAKVTTHSWSRLAGIPVAALGLAYFLTLTPVDAAACLATPQP